MKRVSVIVTFLVVGFLGFNLSAQTKIKLAHINANDLLMVMPGIDSVKKSIESYARQLEDELKAMTAEFEKKYADFERDGGLLTETARKMKMKELQDLQERIELFKDNAQSDLQEKQETLLKPIVDKAKSAIAEVAKEQGYSYVFDTTYPTLLYSDDNDNIIELVKKKLGIK